MAVTVMGVLPCLAGTGWAGAGGVSAPERLEHPSLIPCPRAAQLSPSVPIWVTALHSQHPHPAVPAQLLSQLPRGSEHT